MLLADWLSDFGAVKRSRAQTATPAAILPTIIMTSLINLFMNKLSERKQVGDHHRSTELVLREFETSESIRRSHKLNLTHFLKLPEILKQISGKEFRGSKSGNRGPKLRRRRPGKNAR